MNGGLNEMSAESTVALFQVAANIRSTLAGLRARIRAYVLLDGLAVVATWLVGAFWLGFALDYLPVLAGASEMPRLARAVMLALVGAGAI